MKLKEVYIIIVLISYITLIKTNNKSEYKIDLNIKYDPSEIINKFKPEMIIYYSKMIGMSYCKEEEIIKGKCCNKLIKLKGWKRVSNHSISDKKYYELLNNNLGDYYNYQIFVSEKYKKILIIFPGNRNLLFQIHKEFKNIHLVSTKVKKGLKIMNYTALIYKFINRRFYTQLKNIINYKNYNTFQIIFAGHSLGGMMATIFSFDSIIKNIIPNNNNTVLISLAAPKIGNSIFINTVKKYVPYIFRIIRDGDIFPLIPKKDNLKININNINKIGLFSLLTEYLNIVNKNYDDFDNYYILNDKMTKIYLCNHKSSHNICHKKIISLDIDLNKHFYYFFKNKKISNLCINYDQQNNIFSNYGNKIEF